MHGMINRAVERFVRDTYGRDVWMGVTQSLALDYIEFEPMLVYETGLTDQMLDIVARTLDKDLPDLLEDIGTYLVSHKKTEAIRRLLRFGGVDFHEFLHSLDDLPERVRLAVPDLHLPAMELREHRTNHFTLAVKSGGLRMSGFGHVVMGLLRAMADDYGALVLLDHKGNRDRTEILEVHLADASFAEGRAFDLSQRINA